MDNENENESAIVVLASGRFGAIIANQLARSNETVYLWYADASRVREYSRLHMYVESSFQYALDERVRLITGYKNFSRGSWSIWIVLQSPVMEDILEQMMNRLPRNQRHTMFFLSRGLLSRKTRKKYGIYTFTSLTEIFANSNGFHDFGCVSLNGPSLLGEILQGKHAFLMAGSSDPDRIEIARTQLSRAGIHISASDDMIGVELCGVLKNPVAVAAGMVSTLPICGDNVSGDIIAAGISDFVQLGTALGARSSTLYGRAGIGDLVTTSMSSHSRNRSYGQNFVHRLYSGEEKPNLIQRVELLFHPASFIEREVMEGPFVAEGAFALSAISEIAEEKNLELPFYNLLYRILARRDRPEALLSLSGVPVEKRKSPVKPAPRVQGLHGTAGSSFTSVLEKRVFGAVAESSGMIARIRRQAPQLLNTMKRRLSELGRGDKKEAIEIRTEYELWDRFVHSSEEHESTELQKIISFYVKEISDRYQPGVRETLLRMLTPVRGVLGGFRSGSAVPHIGGHVEQVKRYAKTYNIFYTPTHKTHLDSVEVAFGLNSLGLPVPRYAAARNLMSNPFRSWILKSMGAYAVDRSRTRNILYLECLTQYSTMMLEAGIPTLVFPEGSRSRSGSIATIKTGLLSTAVEAYRNTGSEIIIAPITVSYERIPEDMHFTGMTGHVSFNEFLTNRHGVYMDFGEPIRVSEHMDTESPTLSIAYRISSTWEKNIRVLPNHLLARLLIENDLTLSYDTLPSLVNDFVLSNPGNHLTRDSEEIIKRGVKVLKDRDLVKEERGRIVGRNRIMLNYYGNMLPGLFEIQVGGAND